MLHHVICWCCQHEHERRCTVAFYVPTVLKMFKCSRWIILSSRWLAIAIATCVLCLLYFCDCVYFFSRVCVCFSVYVCEWFSGIMYKHLVHIYIANILHSIPRLCIVYFLSWLHENILYNVFYVVWFVYLYLLFQNN